MSTEKMMPRFYMNLREDDKLLEDPEGQEFRS
jgi:hypothetical protein